MSRKQKGHAHYHASTTDRRATCLLAFPLNLALERAPHRGVEAALACAARGGRHRVSGGEPQCGEPPCMQQGLSQLTCPNAWTKAQFGLKNMLSTRIHAPAARTSDDQAAGVGALRRGHPLHMVGEAGGKGNALRGAARAQAEPCLAERRCLQHLCTAERQSWVGWSRAAG